MNLIIDGNAFLNVAVNVVKQMMFQDKNFGQSYWVEDLVGEGFLLKEVVKREYEEFCIKYLNSIVSMNAFEHVYLVFDSKSWRKEFIKQSDDDRDVDYKGHRKYDEKQYLFFEHFQGSMLEDLSDANMTVIRIPNIEGDDLVTRILELNPTEDFCIWSTDLDFCQLLTNDSRLIMLCTPKMSKKSKNIYTAEGYKPKEVEFNMFDDFSFANTLDPVLEFTKKGFVHIQVNPDKEIIAKLLGGDKSDNIPRVHKGVTPKKLEILVDATLRDYPNFIEVLDKNPGEIIYYFVKLVSTLLKLKEDTHESLKNSIKVNMRVMRLNTKFYPPEIKRTIYEVVDTISSNKFNYHPIKNRVRY
jgi:5'-3' exonuclease